MSTVYHILDVPLPLSQNFRELKELGLEYIQKHSGNAWNNLNPVDPGVTILDQLCYALTELGYVNDFPVKDILTRRDGTLQIKDQFYLPEEMLTTSPVTIDDYRRYIIDGVAGVQNVMILPDTNPDNAVSGVYRVYLQVDESMIVSREAICRTVFFYLNKRRNLDEFFLIPEIFYKDLYEISGKIEIESEVDVLKILKEINDQVRNFILPDVTPISYDSLNAEGVTTNEIFNGPLLVHGWIPAAALGTKKERLQVFELTDLINIIPGVSSTDGLSLRQQKPIEIVPLPGSTIYSVDAVADFESGALNVYCNGVQAKPLLKMTEGFSAGKSLKADTNIQYGATMNIHSEIPKGRFRNIDSYYSIQNTFPEIFAVGADAVDSDAPPYRIAQSRQLKGYLTLFDQVLANQFSQLANLDRLFSFKNYIPEKTHDFGRRHHKYPAPYKTFAPTYFYQPLYKVPHIRPLLKNNEIFNFGIHLEPEKLRQEQSWKKYKYDPYNPYIRGMMELMEDEKDSLERRDVILDHLLAQNGESPYVINSVIDPLLYTGDRLKGQLIFKSLYLQNLGLLSYYRQKAYNYMGAIRISSDIPEVSEDFEQRILGGDTMDFVFRSGKIDWLEKIKKLDFINYSTLELKLFLLFGLRIQYLNYISENYKAAQSDEDLKLTIELAQWMIRQRRGMIMIETGLLFQFGGGQLPVLQQNKVFDNKVIIFFPAFMPGFGTAEFTERLDLFFQSSMPVEVNVEVYFIKPNELKNLIGLFCLWHNELIYTEKTADYYSNTQLQLYSELLAVDIIAINDSQDARTK